LLPTGKDEASLVISMTEQRAWHGKVNLGASAGR
jgi:hypothetical protein